MWVDLSGSAFGYDLSNDTTYDNDTFSGNVTSNLTLRVYSPACDSSWFQPVVGATSFVFCCLSIFALVPNLLLLVAFNRSHLIHSNVRILLTSLTAGCVGTCASLFLQSTYNFMLLSSGDVKQPITVGACAVMQNLRFTCQHVTIFTLLVLSMERLVSTRTRLTTAPYAKWVTGGVSAACVLAWLYAVVFTFYNVLPSRGARYGLCYCEHSFNFAFDDLVVYVAVYVLVDLVALTCFCMVLRNSRDSLRNFGINTANHTLAARFQTWHNIRMTEMLLPSVAVHVGCLVTCAAILLACVRLYQARMEGLSLTLLQTYYFLTVVHATSHPLICIRQNVHVGKAITKLLGGRCANFLSAVNDADVNVTSDGRPENEAKRRGNPAKTVAPAPNALRMALIRNTVGYKVSPEQHQQLMTSHWDRTKQVNKRKSKM